MYNIFTLYRKNQGKLIIFAVLLAFPIAIFYPTLFNKLIFISNTFINLLKLCALPIIFTSLIVIIGTIKDPKKLANIANKSIIYIIITEIIAVMIGIILFNFIDITKGVNGHTLLNHTIYEVNNNSKFSLDNVFNYVFTGNIFASLTKFDILPIVVFSIMLGLICAFNQKEATPIIELCQSIRTMFLKLLNVFMMLAPFAIFALVGLSISQSYLANSLGQNLLGISKLIALFIFALGIHVAWQTIITIYLYRKNFSFLQLISQALPIFVTAFISSSSMITLPKAMETAKSLGGNNKVINFMLPICASMNFASGMMYEVITTLFFMKILNIDISLSNQILLAIACILTGIAVGGIPETSMVSFVPIFQMMGVPVVAISILLPLDRILDRIRTMANIFTNMCATLIVSKFVE